MTIQTQYGYKIPELEDKDFWDSYNFNISRYDGHTHDGIDSAPIFPQATLDPDVATGTGHPAGLDGEMRYKLVLNEVELYIYSPDESDWKQVEGDGIDTDHGNLTGLTDDDHSQYLLLAGRTGGQSLIGGTAAGENLSLESTSDVGKGSIIAKDNLLPSKQIIGNGTNGLLDLRGKQGGDVGGDVSMSGGFGLVTPGKVTITAGASNSIGADVRIKGGDGPTGQSGAVILQGGTSGDDNGPGGDLQMLAGRGGVVTGKGGDVNIFAGDSEGSGQAPGDINIKGGERIGFSERGSLFLQATGGKIIFPLGVAPASATAAGVTGEARYTSDHIYVCVATNTWKRTAISTWV